MMTGKWWEVTIETGLEAADAVQEMLLQLGCAGTSTVNPNDLLALERQEDQTIFISSESLEDLPDYAVVRAYFPEYDGVLSYGVRLADDKGDLGVKLYADQQIRTAAPAELQAIIADKLKSIGAFLDIAPARLSGRFADESEWADNWKQYFHSKQISQRIMIVPSWEESDAPEGVEVIRLDPGSAFGTGLHESTALALRGLDSYLYPASRVLDVGTGSGILALAALRLGARQADLCDVDPNAVRVALENARLNDLDESVKGWVGSVDQAEGVYDMILANLVADVLVRLAPELAKHLARLGLLVSSGIILNRENDVIRAMENAGLKLHARKRLGDWAALMFSHGDHESEAEDLTDD